MTELEYQTLAINKATEFLQTLEVFTKQYHPGGSVIKGGLGSKIDSQADFNNRTYWINFTLCDGDESLGFVVEICLDPNGKYAKYPRAETWCQRPYIGH